MDDEPTEPRPPKREQLSKTPSWIMLGFAIGVVCVLVWPRKPSEPVAPVRVEREPTLAAPEPPTVERAIFFESVFTELSHNAVWQGDVTEVAFWNAAHRDFSDCYEVLRVGDKFYFRSIPQLTRPVMTEGISKDSPIQFTAPTAVTPETFTIPGFRKTDYGVYRNRVEPEHLPLIAAPDIVPPLKKPVIDLPPSNRK